MNNNNRVNQSMLLLGGYGFLGTNLMKHVDKVHLPYRFVVFDRFLRHPAGVEFDCIDKAYAGDFSDERIVESIFAENNIDLVIHSLSSTVPVTSGSVRFDIETNLLPTIQLLDIMVRHNVKKIVFFSSGGAVYGESEKGHPHKESDDVFPKSSYGVVKLAIEKYLFMYREQFNIEPMVLRLSNPYGEYHYSEKQGIINIALRAAKAGKTFIVRGDGSATKDYIYVGDVCRIVFALLGKGVCGEVINVASGELLSVNKILNTIKDRYQNFQWTYEAAYNSDVKRVELSTKRLIENGIKANVNLRQYFDNYLTNE